MAKIEIRLKDVEVSDEVAAHYDFSQPLEYRQVKSREWFENGLGQAAKRSDGRGQPAFTPGQYAVIPGGLKVRIIGKRSDGDGWDYEYASGNRALGLFSDRLTPWTPAVGDKVYVDAKARKLRESNYTRCKGIGVVAPPGCWLPEDGPQVAAVAMLEGGDVFVRLSDLRPAEFAPKPEDDTRPATIADVRRIVDERWMKEAGK